MPKIHLERSPFLPMADGGILFFGFVIASMSSLALKSGTIEVNIRILKKDLKRLYSTSGNTSWSKEARH